jgi:hypothetical protein
MDASACLCNVNYVRASTGKCVCEAGKVCEIKKDNPMDPPNNTDIDTNMVIGVAIGGVVFVVIAAVIALSILRRRKDSWAEVAESAPKILKRPLSLLIPLDNYSRRSSVAGRSVAAPRQSARRTNLAPSASTSSLV